MKGGRVGLVQIDGRTGQDGIDLFTLADMMITLGFEHAINLDGGGSSTTAINGVLASLPSDGCPDDETGLLGCERAVSTIVCLHSNPQQFVVGSI
jgi:N-acetylglucosamine-1-phosphodiester alpha-N-acetylglucosaminidase